MKVLVTGGTGFLGRAIVSRLAKDHALTLLVRPTASRDGFPAGVAFASGDVTDRMSVVTAAQGHDAIIHAAALVKLVATAAEFDRVNVGGSRTCCGPPPSRASRGSSTCRASSPSVPPKRSRRRARRERRRTRARRGSTTTSAPRPLADRRAREAIAAGAPLVVVYPGVIYGPGAMTEGNLVVRGIVERCTAGCRRWSATRRGRWSYVHVDDVAAGVQAALERAATAAATCSAATTSASATSTPRSDALGRAGAASAGCRRGSPRRWAG
jgi:farnesol dehydrogenase